MSNLESLLEQAREEKLRLNNLFERDDGLFQCNFREAVDGHGHHYGIGDSEAAAAWRALETARQERKRIKSYEQRVAPKKPATDDMGGLFA